MKLLQNKSTGEIGCLVCSFGKTPERITVVEYIDGRRGSKVWYYDSLSELCAEWEDVLEEPEEHWAIGQFGEPINVTGLSSLQLEKLRRIGNLFESEEKTERAVEKLKAWERLKDKGFRFDKRYRDNTIHFRWSLSHYFSEIEDDLDICFGGEE